MKRTTTSLTLAVLALLLTAGAALAATVNCDGGTCSGTRGEDTMRGTARFDRMSGFTGNDKMSGSYDGDAMYGGVGLDTIFGEYGADRIFGNDGNDSLNGGPVGDRIFGGPGNDTVDAGPGADYVNVAGDNRVDSVSCGLGGDTAVVDSADLSRGSQEDFIRLSSCENVTVR